MRAAEFFAGIGLVRLALEDCGFDVVFANDIDPKKKALYADNFGEEDFRLADIRSIEAKELPSVDFATASFPCIDLSLAGNRAGIGGKHSSAFWQFTRIVEGLKHRRPAAVMLENVAGLLSSHGGRDLESIIRELNRLGYWCDLALVDAVHFVPQSRPRLFVIGHRKPVNAPAMDFSHVVRPHKVMDFIRNHDYLRWSHVDFPSLPTRKRKLADILDNFEEDDPIWWDAQRTHHLDSQISKRHRQILSKMIRMPHDSFATVYKRMRHGRCMAELRTDGIAGCLRTPRGGSSKQFLIKAGNGCWKVRNMTAREYARLQGVDSSFKIRVPENVALLGFGDAVCVPVVSWIVNHGVKPFLANQ